LFCTIGIILQPDFSASLKLPAWKGRTPSMLLFLVPSGNITIEVPALR
jgi:hypothetical protein